MTLISGVSYYESEDALPSYYGEDSPSGHDVGMGVELGFDDGSALSIFWINPRDIDGMGDAGDLAVVDRPTEAALPGVVQVSYDVSAWQEWQPLVGLGLSVSSMCGIRNCRGAWPPAHTSPEDLR